MTCGLAANNETVSDGFGYYRYSDIVHLVAQTHEDHSYLLNAILSNFNSTAAHSAGRLQTTPSFETSFLNINSDVELDVKHQELVALVGFVCLRKRTSLGVF
jgi:hypothetical protein